ncbi:MAG: response regulator transcription factor [Campylobacterota bacterium]|nr:response regulator transcription factor [Campylobacterota bacterium]
MKILLVEDDVELNGFITDTFRKMGYNIDTCVGQNSRKIFKTVEEYYDLYIVDINLPGINGLELVKKIKKNNIKAKTFIISGDDNIDTILKAYDIGCDDYLKKPFDLREMLAKINKIFKEKLEKHVNITKKCYFDKGIETLFHNGKAVVLTNKESMLFSILMQNVGEMVNNSKIEIAVWGENNGKGHLRQLVSKLKKSLPCPDIIENHSSAGYGIIPKI